MRLSPLAKLLLTICVLAAIAYSLAAIAYGPPPVIRDSFAYNASAHRLLNTGTYEYNSDLTASVEKTKGPTAFTMPGFTLFLAAIYTFLPHSGDVVRNILGAQPTIILVQLLLAVACAVLIARTAHTLGGVRLGWTAGLMAVAYVPFGINATVALTETLSLFLMCALILSAVELVKAKANPEAGVPGRWVFLYGICGGVFVLVRPTIAIWLLVPLATFAWVNRKRLSATWRYPIIAAALIAALISPWVVRNALALDRFVPLTDSSGLVMLASVGGEDLTEREAEIFEKAQKAGKDPYRTVALERIGSQWLMSPTAFITERAYKTWLAVTEYVDLPNDILVDFQMSGLPQPGTFADAQRFMPIRSDRFYRSTYLLLTTYHKLLLAAALLGFVLGRRRAAIWLLASIPLYYIAVHAAILVMVRYFYPVVPAVILLASFGVLGTWSIARSRLAALR